MSDSPGEITKYLIRIGLLLGACLLFLNSVSSVAVRMGLFATLTLVVVARGSIFATWGNLGRLSRGFLCFWGWLVLSSLVTGGIITGNYSSFLTVSRALGALWILEAWRIWGVGLLIVFAGCLGSGNKDESSRNWGHLFFVVAFVFVLLSGYFDYLSGRHWLTGEPLRILGLRTTNSAKILNLFLPFFLVSSLAPSDRGLFFTIGHSVLFVVGSVGLFLTNSRGGIMTYLVAVPLILIGISFYFKASGRRWIALLLVLLLVLSAGILAMTPATKSFRIKVSRTWQKGLTGTFRYQKIWPLAVRLISKRPLIGYGAGTYYPRAEAASGPGRSNLAKVHSHNVFLQVLYQGGAIAMLFFLLFLYLLLKDTFKRVFGLIRGSPYCLAAVVALSTMILVHGLVEVVNWGYVCLLLAQFELGWIDARVNGRNDAK